MKGRAGNISATPFPPAAKAATEQGQVRGPSRWWRGEKLPALTQWETRTTGQKRLRHAWVLQRDKKARIQEGEGHYTLATSVMDHELVVSVQYQS